MFIFRRISWLVMVGLLVSFAPTMAAEEQYYPSDTQFVLIVNVKQILGSPLVKKDLPKIKDHLKNAGDVQTTLTNLGFDPFTDLDSLVVCAVGASDPEKGVVLIKGKFNTEKFQALGQDLAKKLGNQLKVHKEGSNTIYEADVPNVPQPIFLGLVDGSTIVAGAKKGSVTDAFEIKAGKKNSGLKKEVTGLLEKAKASQSISFVALGSALPNEVPLAEQIISITGGITLGEDIQTEVDINTKDADGAKKLKAEVENGLNTAKGILPLLTQDNKQLAPLTELLDVLKISDKDKSVTIKGTVTKDAIEKINKK
jgi:hypothetical protein